MIGQIDNKSRPYILNHTDNVLLITFFASCTKFVKIYGFSYYLFVLYISWNPRIQRTVLAIWDQVRMCTWITVLRLNDYLDSLYVSTL